VQPEHGASDEGALRASLTDGRCFTAVFERRADEIHRYLLHRAGQAYAEELTAETFARAFDGRDGYDPERGSVRAWLFGIATNVLSVHRRAEGRRARAYGRVALRPGPSNDGPEEQVADRELLRSTLSQLDGRDQDVVYLIAGAGLSYEDTAGALGIPVGTVRSRYSRARRRAAALLERDTAGRAGRARPQEA
jgi:RNA polymerase sigma factor (sigma-70 family)